MQNQLHHLPNGTFRNTADIDQPTLRNTQSSFADIVKWKATAPNAKLVAQPVLSADIEAFKNAFTNSGNDLHSSSQETALIWVGHSTFLLRHHELTILTDPHFSLRASPVSFAGPKRSTPPALTVEQLPQVDVVVVSHDHYDHLDKQSVLDLQRKQQDNPPLFVVPLKVGKWFSKLGIDNWIECDWWQSIEHQGWIFSAVPVQHFSGRGLQQNNTLWAGWVLQAPVSDVSHNDKPNKAENQQPYQIFFAGDTGYSDDFKAIYNHFGAMDVSLIPIGAYEPRWFMKEMHVNPAEAVQIHQDVQSKCSIAMHWGSFALTHEPMNEPPIELTRVMRDKGIPAEEFLIVKHGELVRV